MGGRSRAHALDQRREEEDGWIYLGLYPLRFLAQEALEARVAELGEDVGTLRVRKVKAHD